MLCCRSLASIDCAAEFFFASNRKDFSFLDMASSVQAQSGFDSAEGTFNPHFSEDGSDDWVSLMLSDVGFDAESDSSLSLASLANFPLPDLEDMELSNLDGFANRNSSNSSCFDHGITSSFQEGQSTSPSDADVLLDPTQMFQKSFPTSQGEGFPILCRSADQRSSESHACPNLCHPAAFPSPRFSQLATFPPAFCGPENTIFALATSNDALQMPNTYLQSVDTENGISKCSQSPESGLTQVHSEYPDADTNIPVEDSVSDEDNVSFLISDICSEETGNTELEHGSFANVSNMAIHGEDSAKQSRARQVDMDASQTLCGKQIPWGSNNGVKSASVGKVSRKRKALDRKSRSSTPEETAVDCTGKLENPFKEGEIKDEEDERRQARLMRNRESAQLSRQRKKIYVDELEEKIKTMASTIAELNNTINLISAENINLRRQLGLFGPPPGQAGGIPAVAPWAGAYPSGPMVGGRFMVPGSQVPLVPIPRWKSQQATVKKVKKSKSEPQEKGSVEKASKRTKKVAGFAAVGLFFFVFILLPLNLSFLGLKPILHKESKVWPTSQWHMDSGNMVVRAGGRVLTGIIEGTDSRHDEPGTRWGSVGNRGSKNEEKDWQARRVPQEWKTLTGCPTADTDGRVHNDPAYEKNGSVPLAATLFVPRNDRLVRIEGNLIIHSVLAGDRAAIESLNRTENDNVRMQVSHDKGLALDANLKAVVVKAAPQEKGALVELQRALAGRSSFDLQGGGIQSIEEDGSLQQWFLEDLAGPVFSSGMCTEVFQFETSVAASSPSCAAASPSHDTNGLVENKTRLQEHGPRRVGRPVSPSRKSAPYTVPLPPVGHKVIHNGHSKNSSVTGSTDGFEANREFGKQKHSSSSVVVSVLAGSELGNQTKLTGGEKGPSQIFVVVLIDSVKYVTYSCMLPSTGSKPHYEMVVV